MLSAWMAPESTRCLSASLINLRQESIKEVPIQDCCSVEGSSPLRTGAPHTRTPCTCAGR